MKKPAFGVAVSKPYVSNDVKTYYHRIGTTWEYGNGTVLETMGTYFGHQRYNWDMIYHRDRWLRWEERWQSSHLTGFSHQSWPILFSTGCRG